MVRTLIFKRCSSCIEYGLQVVPRHSACVPGAVDTAVIGLSSDHSNMVKFKHGEEEGFIAVADTLVVMLRHAMENVNSNWREWETIKGL